MNNEQQKLCEEIWREYEAYIIKLCNAKLSSHLDEAAELVSEVYEALCEAIDAGKNINNPKPWLYSVANNKLKEKYTEINRKKAFETSLDSSYLYSIELVKSTDILDEMVSEEDISKMKSKIDEELLPIESDLIKYHYEENMKLKDMAKIVGKTESAIKQSNLRLSRKVQRLAKEKLEDFFKF